MMNIDFNPAKILTWALVALVAVLVIIAGFFIAREDSNTFISDQPIEPELRIIIKDEVPVDTIFIYRRPID